MKEEWKSIKDLPDYQISNIGRVKRLARDVKNRYGYRHLDEQIFTGYNDGYNHLVVSINGKQMFVHRLVAAAFLGLELIDKSLVVHHNDFDATNNCVDNLSIMTQQEHASVHYNTNINFIQSSKTGELNPFYGKHHTDETKRLISENRRRK